MESEWWTTPWLSGEGIELRWTAEASLHTGEVKGVDWAVFAVAEGRHSDRKSPLLSNQPPLSFQAGIRVEPF